MNLKALSNSIDFNVNSIYDVFVYFVDIASVVNMLFRLIMVIDIKISRLTLLSTGYYINLLFLCANAVCCCAVYFCVVWYCGCASDDSFMRAVG